MSSLVGELRDTNSPVTRYLREAFPHHKPIQAAYRARAGTVRLVPPAGVAGGTQGAAIDWWLRFLVDPEPSLDLAVWSCLRAGPAGWARAGMQMLYALGGVDDSLTLHAVDPEVWRDRPDRWMARLCYALALLVEPLRNPAALLGSRLMQLDEDAGPRELAALATADEVADLIAMRDLASETLLPALAGKPAESGPNVRWQRGSPRRRRPDRRGSVAGRQGESGWQPPQGAWMLYVPPAGFEPAHPPPEGGALSPELRGLWGNAAYVTRRERRIARPGAP
ncbi:hypothetical protein FRACA_260029 [Frankia canadensis]|uniref:Uncharacterized protein n=1 Tax=Frankia canadensis TaxID=1836972 RepID=A0A2I2KSG8_9ACTN|nr:hypothetical protein FRACA_260029 [Frankia canadensis]SOU55866.1 hypothetical protein FRACA_260029 [Frankia canadensis]